MDFLALISDPDLVSCLRLCRRTTLTDVLVDCAPAGVIGVEFRRTDEATPNP